MILIDELLHRGERPGWRVPVVLEDHRELAAVDAARGIDFLDRESGAVAAGETDIGGGTGDRAEGADGDAIRRNAGFVGTRLSGECAKERAKHGGRTKHATKPLPKHPVLPYIFF